MTNSLEMTVKNIFFNSLLEGLRYWFCFIKNHLALTVGLYLTITGLALFAHYSSNQFFGLSVFSLLFPLFIQCLCLFTLGFSCLFVLPYFFQKMLNKEDEFIYIPSTFHKFLFENFRPWIKEMSKVLAVSYLWGLLLIVPGLVKLIKCSFVNYIVLFNKSYRIQEVSALKHSSKLTKGFTLWFLLLVATYMGLSYPVGYLTQDIQTEVFSWKTVGAIALEYLWTVLASFFISITYHLIYLKRDQELYEPSESYEEPPAVVSAVL